MTRYPLVHCARMYEADDRARVARFSAVSVAQADRRWRCYVALLDATAGPITDEVRSRCEREARQVRESDGSGYMLDPTRLGFVRQEEWHAFTVTFRVNDDKPRVWLRFAPDTDHARDAAVEAIEAEWPAARFIEIVSVIPERPRRTVSEVFHATL